MKYSLEIPETPKIFKKSTFSVANWVQVLMKQNLALTILKELSIIHNCCCVETNLEADKKVVSVMPGVHLALLANQKLLPNKTQE